MRPDDRSGRWDLPDGVDGFGPLDADLVAIDAELGEAGLQGRRALHGRTQPTRFFSNQLRERLLATYPLASAGAGAASDARASAASARSMPSGPQRRTGRSELAAAGEAWAPVPLEPRISRRPPAAIPRSRWGLLAAAMLTAAIGAVAVGARLDWVLPEATARPSAPLVALDPTARPSDGPVPSPVLTVPSSGPTLGPEATPSSTGPAVTPKPTPKPTPKSTPKPTPKPDPTKPPVLSMELLAKPCPGGVILDWTKPSTDVAHYHVLRSLGGDVPPTYPAAGTTEVETATSFSAGTTDGFDATIEGGSAATYRAFAFDAADDVMGYSQSRTVTTVGRIALGGLTVEGAGAGSIDVSWASAEVPAACFTYGKLVASESDPDPSYLKGSSYWAVIDSPSTTSIHLDGLPSGTTVWMRYEIVRATSLGKFVVARTDAVKVIIP